MAKRKDAQYLFRRNTIYYCRIKVPEELRSRFGITDFRYSLQTPYLIHAKKLSRSISDFIHQIFINIRHGGEMSTLSKEQLQTIIKEYVKDFIDSFELGEATNSKKLNPDSHNNLLDGYDWVISEEHDNLAERRHVDRMSTKADKIIKDIGLNLDESSDDYHLLCWLLLKAKIRSLEACRSRLVHRLQGHTIDDILSDLDIANSVVTIQPTSMPTPMPQFYANIKFKFFSNIPIY